MSETSADHFLCIATDIEADLKSRILQADLAPSLRDAVLYSALGPGKRIRPLLTVLCCEAVGGDRGLAMPAACAVELVHCFSLVHDDLPAMDNDELRRGRPTLHVHAGEAMAILSGDVMTTLAFEIICQARLSSDVRVQLMRELASATREMISGQVYDTLGGFAPELSDQHRLQLIHTHKTGALIRAACLMGAISGEASESQIQAITQYGDAIGLMFQIVDDLLDVTQSATHVGKATGKDESAGKLTFPGVMGVEQSRREIARLCEHAHQAVARLGPAGLAHPPSSALIDLCNRMAVRTK